VLEYGSIGVLEYWFLSACITPLFHHSTTPVPLGLPLFSTSLHSHTLMTPNVHANRRRAGALPVLGVESHGRTNGQLQEGHVTRRSLLRSRGTLWPRLVRAP